MKKRQLGTTGFELAPVTLGTWALGGWLWGGTAKNKAEDAIKASLDAGINGIDTAPAYGFGLSEELVGRAIRGRRPEVLLATKCGLVWDDRPGTTFFFESKDPAGKPVRMSRCLRKASILAECDLSLKRLGVDVIDLYQCHWPDDGTPIEETVEALVTLRDQGKIREFGVSNFSVDQMKDFLKHAPLASNQVKYSLLSREIEKDVLPFCRKKGIGVLAYSPLEMGLLAGKIGMDVKFPESDTRGKRPWFEPAKRKEVLDVLEQVKPIAAKYGATVGQMAVAWIFSQAGVTSALAGARDGEQAVSNATAAKMVPAPGDLDALRALFEPLKLDKPFDAATAKR